MEIYLKALGFIFLAEMGDKTQILAMVLATRYKLKDVLIGILLGSFLNHGIAIFLGMGLLTFIPIDRVQIMAGILFVFFAFWTLKFDSEDEEDGKSVSYLPVIAVATLFFVGELGDKTQLTAVTLAIENGSPFITLLGTTSGMLVTSGIGIVMGLKLGHKLKEHMIKYCSSAVFLVYGLVKLSNLISSTSTIVLTILTSVVIYFVLLSRYFSQVQTSETTAFQIAATSLKEYKESMTTNFEFACHGIDACKTCMGTNCSIGYLKSLIVSLEKGEKESMPSSYLNLKNHSRIQTKTLKESLLITVLRLTLDDETQNKEIKNEVRKTLEKILYKKFVQIDFDKDLYVHELSKVDRVLSNKMKRLI